MAKDRSQKWSIFGHRESAVAWYIYAWLFTHKAIRTGLNISKNLPTELGKYHRIP